MVRAILIHALVYGKVWGGSLASSFLLDDDPFGFLHWAGMSRGTMRLGPTSCRTFRTVQHTVEFRVHVRILIILLTAWFDE